MPGGIYQRMLNDRSNGRLKLNITPKMFPINDVLAAVGQGKVDMGDLAIPYISGSYPLWAFGTASGLPFSNDIGETVVQSEMVYSDPRLAEIWDETFREVGAVHLLTPQSGSGGSILFSHKKISSMEDFKTLKVRGAGFYQTESMKALGASAITIPFAEIETALQRGTVDAIMTGIDYGYVRGLLDIVEHVSVLPVSPTFDFAVVMNDDKFDSLPPDLQQILRDVSDELEGRIFEATLNDMYSYKLVYGRSGVELAKLPPTVWDEAVERCKPVLDMWLNDAGPYAPEVLSIIEDNVARFNSFQPSWYLKW
jgi:TRAP-type C4-dicarboxylate transport system substrate-binding protein